LEGKSAALDSRIASIDSKKAQLSQQLRQKELDLNNARERFRQMGTSPKFMQWSELHNKINELKGERDLKANKIQADHEQKLAGILQQQEQVIMGSADSTWNRLEREKRRLEDEKGALWAKQIRPYEDQLVLLSARKTALENEAVRGCWAAYDLVKKLEAEHWELKQKLEHYNEL
ncbi:MAG: hypothetical protein ABIG95_06790, partial [Candidatus Woesearchaeota archaeon]